MAAAAGATRRGLRRPSRLDGVASFFAPRNPPRERPWTASLGRFAGARALIVAYYAVIFYFTVANLYTWAGYLETTDLSPRWPVFWLRFVDLRTGISAILWLHLIGGLVAIAFTRFRAARIVVVLALLEYLAFKYSFGAINHGDHLSLLIAFVLIFLPTHWTSLDRSTRRVRAETLLVFSGCQAMILLTYSMAGLWKVGGVVRQLVKGEVSALHPQGLAQQVAAKLLEDETTSVLGPWLIEHSWIGWPFMSLTLYLQFTAIWIVARPSLHVVWGLGLIAFHISSHLTMGVGFAENTLWLALFLVASPLRPERLSPSQALFDLPLIGGQLARALGRRASA